MNLGKFLRITLRVAKIAVKSAPAIVVAVGAVKQAARAEKR